MPATSREPPNLLLPQPARVRRKRTLRAGDWVEVRPLHEVLATLDSRGCLDAMPFMAEMSQFCGKRFQVFKSAHKTCDTIYSFTGRRLEDAVHLDGLRCDGSFHGGCQAGCLLFWKEAWLRPIDDARTGAARALAGDGGAAEHATRVDAGATLARQAVLDPFPNGEPRYRCQATELLGATAPLRFYDPRPYLQDLATRNQSWWTLLRAAVLWLYELQQRRLGTPPCSLPRGAAEHEPRSENAALRPGELVQVRSKTEILSTLDDKGQNRGLSFDTEMAPYCGRNFRVLRRIDRILDEKTGKMLRLRKDCIILDGVVCSGLHCGIRRLGCPRSTYPYWREAWLRRIDGAPARASETDAPSSPPSDPEVLEG